MATSTQPSQMPSGGQVASHSQVNTLPVDGRRLFMTAKLAAVGSIAIVTAANASGTIGPVIPSMIPTLK